VRDAFAAVTHKPVRHVPVPVLPPLASERSVSEFPGLSAAEGRFMFLVVFDHLSVTERKNPVGAIEAFRRAFPAGAGPILVVKSMNSALRWPDHQRVLAAAHGRDDILFVDDVLGREDLMALVSHADCLVSLHRSEGLGLHLAEAMWLGTPTIATRYSGNLDFMDDTCALLVEAGRVRVGVHGQGVYPATATWADPDIEQAAAAMVRLAGDQGLAERLAAAGLDRMRRQPDVPATGRMLADLLGGGQQGTV